MIPYVLLVYTSMYDVLCIMYDVLCTMYHVLCTPYYVRCTMYSVLLIFSTRYVLPYVLCTTRYFEYSV